MVVSPYIFNVGYDSWETATDIPLSDSDEPADPESTDPRYYGFLHTDDSWYILKCTSASSPAYAYTYRFAHGKSDYATNWANRANLTYTLEG